MSEQQFVIQRLFDCDQRDLSVAFYEVATLRYGKDAITGIRAGWRKLWQIMPVGQIMVRVGKDEHKTGVYGALIIKKIRVGFEIFDKFPVIAAFHVDPAHKEEVEAFFGAIKTHLETKSIYRGRAIDSAGEFLDLEGLSEADVVYNPKVYRDLNAQVWTPIRRAALCRELRIKRSRKILFAGPFGAGKTVAALLTAQLGVKHGYTFFYLRPTEKDGLGVLRDLIAFARRYPPAIVFIEDSEREQRSSQMYEHGAISVELDGIKSKNDDIIFILTSNFTDKISPVMLRPGRIDKVINFGLFTAEDMERLLRKVIREDLLAKDVNWKQVTDACAKFTPAFVEEVGQAALLLAMSESETCLPLVGTDVLVEAAKDLMRQNELSNGKIGF